MRELLLRIFGRLENSFVLKGFNPWVDHVFVSKAQEGEEAEKAKRHELVVKRFRAKMQNKGLFMCYAGWQAFIARIKWERLVVARFAKKISQRCLVSSIGGWREWPQRGARTAASPALTRRGSASCGARPLATVDAGTDNAITSSALPSRR